MPIADAVREYLEGSGRPFEVIEHGTAESAAEEARQAHVSPEDVAKTLVVRRRSGGDVLAVIRGTDRLDMGAVRAAAEDLHARLATEDELAGDYPRFEVGALPPLPEMTLARIIADRAVLAREQVVFPGGTHTASVRMSSADWQALASPTPADLARTGN